MSRRPRDATAADIAQEARRLVRRTGSAALATARGKDGWPYASLVTVALDHDASPICLFSRLSDHTRNLEADGRATLLFEQASGRRNPQTGPRVSVVGTFMPSKRAGDRARFLARHPDARLYADFGDFSFWRMRVESAHYVGGFARAHWIPARRVLAPAAAAKALAVAEQGIVQHMNSDHADTLDLYAHALLGRRGRGWRCTGADPDGLDLRLGGRAARLDFAAPVADAHGCRKALIELAGQARAISPQRS